MEQINDELLCLTAQMLIDAKGADTFEATEIMLRNMLSNRETARNVVLLKFIEGMR